MKRSFPAFKRGWCGETIDGTDVAGRSGGDGGRRTAHAVYLLYIAGFFTGITALIGVVLAYLHRDEAADPFKSHFSHQIRIFWRGVGFVVMICVINLIISAIDVATDELTVTLELIPIGFGLWWLISTIVAVAKGMGALGRHDPIDL